MKRKSIALRMRLRRSFSRSLEVKRQDFVPKCKVDEVRDDRIFGGCLSGRPTCRSLSQIYGRP